LDEIEVKLLSYTPDPEQLCPSAALTSTRPVATSKIFEELDVCVRGSERIKPRNSTFRMFLESYKEVCLPNQEEI